MADPTRKDSLHMVRVDPTTLLALAARAEAGGDDSLSDDVWRAMGWTSFRDGENEVWIDPKFPDDGDYDDRPDLCRSLDAVEELPGPQIINMWQQSEAGTDGVKIDWFHAEALGGGSDGLSRAPTECLARLSAKLKALAAQESGDA